MRAGTSTPDPTPLLLARHAIAVAVHLDARAALQEPRRFGARGHLRAVDAAVAARAGQLFRRCRHGARRRRDCRQRHHGCRQSCRNVFARPVLLAKVARQHGIACAVHAALQGQRHPFFGHVGAAVVLVARRPGLAVAHHAVAQVLLAVVDLADGAAVVVAGVRVDIRAAGRPRHG